ncbi:30S ribosomal protein S17 [Candidatus Woesearchaeota archaeon]|nr:30S ribosomal protein S17 [Candidatus Woesearchaeota archaeon]
MKYSRNIGMVVEMPKQECNDIKCPFHGKLTARGRHLTGTVLSTKMRKTAVVEFERLHFLPKYERYEKRRTKLKVHNPECTNAKNGDRVRIIECRPLSKTKNFVIVQILGHEKGFKEKMEARESAKVADKEKEEVNGQRRE